MTLELYTELRKDIELRWNAADVVLKSFETNNLGLVIDSKSKSFKSAKRNYDVVFNQIRTLNKHTCNKIKRQYHTNKK